jgi:uncharacterized membrane protein SirB2
MNNHDQPSSENPFVSPSPTPIEPVADAIVVQSQTTWPAVLGIVAIVFGGFGLLGGCLGLASTLFMAGPLADLAAQSGSNNAIVFEQMQEFKSWILAFVVGGAVLAAWLLVSGIGILRRQSWAGSSAMSWAVAKMFLVAGQIVFNFQMQQQQFAAISNADKSPFNMGQFGQIIAVVSAVFGLIWGWALPVFLIIWFRRASIKAETASWK